MTRVIDPGSMVEKELQEFIEACLRQHELDILREVFREGTYG